MNLVYIIYSFLHISLSKYIDMYIIASININFLIWASIMYTFQTKSFDYLLPINNNDTTTALAITYRNICT